MITIALCEDNLIHQQRIYNLITSILDQEHTIDTFSSANDFRSYILSESRPAISYDIVFMDIELGDDSGITLTQEINQKLPNAQVIYITEHLKYVSPVYDTRHLYFIEKSTMNAYLPPALHIALEQISKLNDHYLKFCWNKTTNTIQQKNIIYMERILRTTEIHTFTQTFYTSDKLTELIHRLNDSFVICHRSFLINMNMITRLEKDHVILNGNIELPVSRNQYNAVKDKFNMLIAK